MRIVNGNGASMRYIMALDFLSTIFIGRNVCNITMENILAKFITVEDAAAARPIFSNVPPKKIGAHESMIEDDMGRARESPKQER